MTSTKIEGNHVEASHALTVANALSPQKVQGKITVAIAAQPSMSSTVTMDHFVSTDRLNFAASRRDHSPTLNSVSIMENARTVLIVIALVDSMALVARSRFTKVNLRKISKPTWTMSTLVG